MTGVVEVAAGVIFDKAGRVLIAKRADHLHQGGFWEFPGGKLEPGETSRQALDRELYEELGITVQTADPLIQLRHDYPDRAIHLDVWRVDEFTGEPHGQEGQPVRWVAKESLLEYDFPAANQPIVTASRLPDRYALLDAASLDAPDLSARLSACEVQGIELIRLRDTGPDSDHYRALARQAADICKAKGLTLMLDGNADLVGHTGAAGLHLTTAQLMNLTTRPLDRSCWIGASCHDAMQLRQAAAIGADFAILGPVARTRTHPLAQPMGWEWFEGLVRQARLPVYALGGMEPSHLAEARQRGAQGIAAIRGFGI